MGVQRQHHHLPPGGCGHVSASALYAPVKNSDKTLLQTLLDSGAITGSTVVIWDYTPILFDEDVASFLFYPVAGSLPASPPSASTS